MEQVTRNGFFARNRHKRAEYAVKFSFDSINMINATSNLPFDYKQTAAPYTTKTENQLYRELSVFNENKIWTH